MAGGSAGGSEGGAGGGGASPGGGGGGAPPPGGGGGGGGGCPPHGFVRKPQPPQPPHLPTKIVSRGLSSYTTGIYSRDTVVFVCIFNKRYITIPANTATLIPKRVFVFITLTKKKNDINRMPVYENGQTCPAEDSMGFPISKNRNEVVILTGTDGQTYCYNIEDIRQYIMDDTDFPTGLLYVEALPYPEIINQILPQITNDPEFTTKLENILHPPANAAVYQPPAEFLRLIKRLGQCLFYFNNKGTAQNVANTTLSRRLQNRGMSLMNENVCRTINFVPYVQAISSYLESVDDETRRGIRGLIFEGYRGRSGQFNAAIERGNRPYREITFGEYIDGVFQQEECMGTTASNLINFYNKLQRNRGHPELEIRKELIPDADAARFCPRVEYTTNIDRVINRSPLFSANEGGRRKRTRRNHIRKRNRKTRSRNRK